GGAGGGGGGGRGEVATRSDTQQSPAAKRTTGREKRSVDTASGPDGGSEANAGAARAVSAGVGARGPPSRSTAVFASPIGGGINRPSSRAVSPCAAVVAAVTSKVLSRSRCSVSGDAMKTITALTGTGSAAEAHGGNTLVDFITTASKAATATAYKHRAGIVGANRSRRASSGDAASGVTAPPGSGDEEVPDTKVFYDAAAAAVVTMERRARIAHRRSQRTSAGDFGEEYTTSSHLVQGCAEAPGSSAAAAFAAAVGAAAAADAAAIAGKASFDGGRSLRTDIMGESTPPLGKGTDGGSAQGGGRETPPVGAAKGQPALKQAASGKA
ncbi:unnamed protein product, partial [Laminaria digitata]